MVTLAFRRILAPLDGSDLAERGFAYALRLAQPLNLTLTLLRVAGSAQGLGDPQ